MIAVKTEGRLGNQLFQYAFIFAAARRLNTSFYIDTSIEPFVLDRYFNVSRGGRLGFLDRQLFSIGGYRNFFSYFLKVRFYAMLRRILLHKEIFFDDTRAPAAELTRVENGAMFRGFFQSESYFAGAAADIRREFSVKRRFREIFEHLVNALPPYQKLVSIHLRRTDYIAAGMALPFSYYQRAITAVDKPGNLYVIVSDDPDYAEAWFADLPNKYISRSESIVDLQFLAAAHTCILSSSSFSWWGAWLNPNKPRVIVPANWNGDEIEFPAGILQPGWEQMSHEP